MMLVAIALSMLAQEGDGALRWTGCGITKKAFMAELVKAYEKETGIVIALSGGGATRGIRSVANKSSTLGGSCRHALPAPEEEQAVLLPVAWDALVVVVHRSNPVVSVSKTQLARVFEGTTTDWAELGAPELGKIRVHARRGKTSGVGFMARLLIFFDQDKSFAASVEHPSSGPLEAAVGKDPGAIAITGIASARRRPELKILALDGVLPSAASILDQSYDLIRPLYLTVHAEDRASGPGSGFVQFALSEKGQKAIASTGTIPIRQSGSRLFPLFFEKLRRAEQEVARHRAALVILNNVFEMPMEELLEMEFEE